ncbi:hypothetical protein FGO68_gene66 [Halteria grandinella]|uniref:Uncharacterized protein n=1 Tax=Halteria grandinella TaxID=5974 RepID=A0A8J8NCK3_HALGN|nr:hypothetical protein FGO68_gene66 [Halteria grandinella]
MDTPLRMFKILLTRHTHSLKYPTSQATQPFSAVKDAYFMDDIKLDDLSKVMKFANQLLGANPQLSLSQFSIESPIMQSLNVSEFIHSLQLLEQQKNNAITKELISQPLIRENLEELYPFDINDFKEYLDKVRKLHLKIKQIYDFQGYDLDPGNNLKTRDLQELIDALKAQHDFIHETEQVHGMYLQMKARLDRFCNREFLPVQGSGFEVIEIVVDEFEVIQAGKKEQAVNVQGASPPE